MRSLTFRWLLLSLLPVSGVAAQSPDTASVTMPAGHYVVQARDTTSPIGMAGWPFVLNGNGNFAFTTPDSLEFSGKLVQKGGLATFTDQTCGDPGIYVIRKERGGYALDFKSEACAGRETGLVQLLFLPASKQN